MVEVSAEVLQKSKDWLKQASAVWKDRVCMGNTTYIDRWEEVAKAHTACHAWVSYAFNNIQDLHKARKNPNDYSRWGAPYKEDAKPFLTLTCYGKVRSKGVCSPEATDFLIRWVAHESPFSEFILNRDDDDSLINGGAVLLCGPGGLSHAQTMWVCKVLRFISEGAQAADTFMTLIKGGVDGMLAIYIASHIRSVQGAVFGYTGIMGHMSVVGSDWAEADVIGMYQRNLNPNAYTTCTVFSAIKKSIPSEFDVPKTFAPTIREFCKPLKKPDGWGGFVEGEGADPVSLVERALAWQEKLKVCLPSSTGTPLSVPQMPDSNTVYLDLDL